MDFKNSDIVTGPAIVDLGSADAAASLEAAATLAVAMQAGNILPLTADGQLVLPAGVGLDDIKVVGRDLVIQMPDGTQMIVPDGAVFVPQIVVDGVAVPPLNIAALLIGQEPVPEAGRPQSSGGNFADAVGDIGDPFALGDLLPPTALAFPEPEEREIVPDLVDEEPTTIIITPDQPAGSINATASVQEAALPARGSEPSGSNPTSNAETTTGSIVFDAPDGLGSITLNGVAITAVGQTFVTPLGTLTITSIAVGNIGYSYTLTDNTTAPSSNDVFAVVVTDSDGDAASANLTINIVDDVPTARNDTDSVAAGSYTAQTGNVISGVGTTSGNAGADTPGADGAVVSGARAGTAAGTFAGVGTTINGQYGTLTIAANGSYTYVRNAGTPGGVNDVFTYQITDGDGDTSTATLTISIGDAPPAVTQVPTTGDGTVVSESGLPARGNEPPGSNTAAPSESTSGTITFTPGDAPATVAINGTTITGSGQVITVPTGTLTITSYNPSGTIGYTFTLTDNTSGDTTSQVFTVTVTDADGDTDTEPFTITIVDDVPTARDDSATQSVENTPVVVNVITNDTSGADGVNLTTGVALVAGSLSGTGSVAYNSNGTFTYTPGPGEEGTVTFRYTITDGDGDTSTATATITLAEDSVPFIEIGGDRDVTEAGLPARGSESAGSDSASNSETATGVIALGTGNDSIGSLVINGVSVTAGGTVTGASGTLTVTLNAGEYSYTYTLTDNTSGDATTDSFTVVLTDSDGDTATDTLVIDIIDDVPTAIEDSDSVAAGSYGPVTGNVITDAAAGDEGDGDTGADTQGADSVVVTAVSGSGDGTVGGATAGTHGVLTLNADGSYSYTRNPGTQGGVSDVFTYTITDGDGDTSTTTLTISIGDSETTLDLPTSGEAGTIVFEAGLPARGGEPAGSAGDDSEMTSGIINYTAPDGPATVTINGTAVTTIGQEIVTAYGTMKIDSIAVGSIGYTYTLADNVLDMPPSDDFYVVVIDQDGDSSDAILEIAISDDAPTAIEDADSVTEDSPVAADGNVLLGSGGVDANTTDGVADTQGADGAIVTAVSFAGTLGAVGGDTPGNYGVLTLNTDGSYSYALDSELPIVQGLSVGETLAETFTYTITDADGETSETTLTITIEGSDDDVYIFGLDGDGPDLIVDEDDLPADRVGTTEAAGSDQTPESLNAVNSFTVTAADGLGVIVLESLNGVDFPEPIKIFENGIGYVGVGYSSPYGGFSISDIAMTSSADGQITSVTFTYQYSLVDNRDDHPALGEDGLVDVVTVRATDVDGSTATANVDIRIIDDVPEAFNDTDTVLNGSSDPATGNVITDAEMDGGKDTPGADGVTVTAITGVAAGTVGGTTNGAYGVLTINADGSYSYVRNDGTPGNVEDVFAYTITDADGDISEATLTIFIEDARPIVGPNATVVLDDDAQANGNPLADSGTDDADPQNAMGTLSGSGGDGALTWAFNPGTAPTGFTYEAGPGGSLLVKQGGNTVLTITLDATNGDYSVVQNAPILHADGNLENNAVFSIGYTVTDIDLDSTPGTLTISVDDDVPTAIDDLARTVVEGAVAINGNVLTNDAQGADGATLTHVNLGSGMVAITSGTPVGDAFSFAVAGKGTYTFKADGSWTFAPSGNLNNASGTNAGFTYTITDADKDTSVAAQPITIEDGADPTSSKNASITVNEEGLANANATGSVSNNSENDSDTVTFNAGSDNIVSVAFGDTTGITVNVNGVDGADIVWTAVGTTQIEGRIGGVLAITLTLVPPALPILAGASASATVNVALTDNFPHPNANGENTISLTGISVVATDTDNDTATATVAVTVIDDIARADDDAVGLTEGGPSFVTFDVDTNDVPGADGTGSRVFTSLTGTYGNITLNGDGTQTYTLTAAGQLAIDALPPGVTLTDTFSYTLTDGDGDSDPAQLVVTLTGTDDPVTITNLTPKADGGDAVVDEDDLPAGSDTAKESLTTPGNFTISAPDGVASLTVGGVLVVSNGVFTEPAPLVTPLGNTLTFTGYNPATGVVSYSYTLNAAETHPNANGENNLFEDFAVVLTDADPVNPDVANSTLSIQVIDDVPTAVNDTAQSVAEDGANIGGNVRANDTQGADGATVTHINLGSGFVAISDGVNLGGGVFQHSTANGVYTISATGAWTFNPNTNLNNASGISASFSYRLTDADGDISEAVQPITVTDGANPSATKNASIIVNEEGLANGNATGSVNNNTENGSDTVTFQAGSDNITSIAFGDVTNLTADVNGVVGNDISWTRVSATQITGSIGGILAITINLVPPTLPILAGASGSATVNVILSDNFPHPNAAGENTISLTGLEVVAIDTDNDPATATVSVTVVDDVPTANADTDSVKEDGPTVANGNVLTAAAVASPDANTTDGVADIQGADGATVTGVVFGSATGPVIGNVGGTVNGTYGTLTLAAGGGYTYTLNNSLAAVQSLSAGQNLTETFTYSITDGDGDPSTTTLTITINGTDDGVVIDGLGSNAEEIVYENDLSDGTSPNAPALTQTGTFNVTAVDGLATIVIGGVTIVSAGALTGTLTVDTPLGLLTITGFTPTLGAGGEVIGGTVSYSYLLQDNSLAHTVAGPDGNVFDNFLVVVTDVDGSNSNATLNVEIIDDVPSLGIVQNQQASNNPLQTPAIGTLHFTDGADGAGTAMTITANTTGLTSGGLPVLTSQTGNVLTGYVNTNGTTGYQAGSDTAVFTLTVNPNAGTSGQYVFDLMAPLDGTVVDTPLGSATAFGSGPATLQQLSSTAGGPILSIVSGWQTTAGFNVTNWFNGTNALPSGLNLANVNGSTNGWGVNNQNFTAGEFLRFDFGSPVTDFDGAGAYTPPSITMQPVSFAVFDLIGYGSTETIQFRVHFTDGTSAAVTSTGSQTGFRIEAPAGKLIDWIDLYTADGSGNGKIDLVSVGVQSEVVDRTLNFTVQLTDGDGDPTSTNAFTVRVADGLTPSVPAPPVALDLDGDGVEFVSQSAGVTFDYAGDGSRETTAWVGPDDGLLAIDRNGDGIVNDGSEIVFARNGLTDLQGLAADYDSDKDGVLTAADDGYALFGVWQDANGNGVTDAGEFQSLTDAGIVSVGLVSDGIGYSAANGDVSVAGQALYTKADGSTGIVADAAFATTAAQAASRSSDQLRTSNVTSSIVAASLVGLAADATPAFADLGDMRGTQMVQFDYQPFVSSFEPFNMASVQQDFVRTNFAPTQDFAQRIGQVSSSLRAMDEADVGFDMQDATIREMSGLLGDSMSPVNASGHGSMAAFGSDLVMHNVLDMAAFGMPTGANDNPAAQMAAGDVIRNAMPDIMMDRLVDSFSGDVGSTGDSIVANGAGADALRGMLDITIDSTHFSVINNTDLMGSQQYEMATANN